MIDVGTLEGTLSLKDVFTGVLTQASSKLKTFRDEFSSTMAKNARENEAFAAGMKKSSESFMDAGRSLIAVSAIAATAVIGIGKVSMDFESSFAGVRKTITATEPELQRMSQGFRNMSKEIPVAITEIHAIAEAAGQLGIAKENVMGFTRVMADLGVATNLTSEEAAEGLAKMANITQMNQKEFDRLGSTLVHLGNNSAATEKDILAMSLRLAGAGNIVGMTEAQIMGFASALSSVGIEAEAGGSAMSKVMIDMASSVATADDNLKNFASTAGKSMGEFQQIFKEDAAGALRLFIEGLGEMHEKGGNVLGLLEEMGIKEVRMRDALLRSAGAGKLMAESLKLANAGWEQNNALSREAQARYDTLASKFQIMWNRVKDLAIEIGTNLIPVMKNFMDNALDPMLSGLAKLAEMFSALPQPVQTAVIAVAGLLAALAPVLMLVGQVAGAISTLAGLGVTGALIVSFGKVAAIVALVVGALYGSGKLLWALGEATGLFETISKAAGMFSDMIDRVRGKIGDSVWKGFTDMLHQIKMVGAEAWDALVGLLSIFVPGAKDLDAFEVALKGVEIAIQLVANVLIDAMKLVQQFAWGMRQAADAARYMYDQTSRFFGKKDQSTWLPMTGRPSEFGVGGGFNLGFDIEAALAGTLPQGRKPGGNPPKPPGGGGAGGSTAKTQLDELARAAKAADEAFLKLIGANIVQETLEMANAFEAAKKAGIALSREALADLAKKADQSMQVLDRIGEVPPYFKALKLETGLLSTELTSLYRVGMDGLAILENTGKSIDANWLIPQKNISTMLMTNLPKIKGETDKATKSTMTWSQSLGDLATAFRDVAQTSDGALGSFAATMGNLVQSMQLGDKAGKSMFSGFTTMKEGGLKNFALGFAQLATGIMSAVSAMNQATQSSSRWTNALGGAASGASVGAAFGPWGALAGGVIGGIYGAFKSNKPKGPTPMEEHLARVAEYERQQVEKLTAAYNELHAKTNDTMGELLSQASELGIRLPDALQKSIGRQEILNQLTAENKNLLEEMANAAEVDYRKMEEAANRYGIPLESLGGQFNQLRMDDVTQAIINDFDLLQRGGTDVGTILHGMRDEISEVVNQSRKFGTTIPENMKPWINELMRAGLLVDEQGRKLTDIGGLQFGASVETEFERITSAIERLVSVIENDLIAAFNRIPRQVDTNVNVNTSTNGDPNTGSGGGVYVPNGGDYSSTQGVNQMNSGSSSTVPITLVVKNHSVLTEAVGEGLAEKLKNEGAWT